MYYNRALINGDSTGLGIASLNVLLRHNYSNIYVPDKDPDVVDASEGPRYWYRFTPLSRHRLFDEFRQAIRANHAEGEARWRGVLAILSQDIIEEEKTWVLDERGRPDHMANSFDDLITAAALANWAHRHTYCRLDGVQYSSEAMRNGFYEGSVDVDSDLEDPIEVTYGDITRRRA